MRRSLVSNLTDAIIGNLRPGFSGGTTRFELTLANGTTRRLQIDAAQQNVAVQYFGKRVAIKGRMIRGARGESTIVVDSIDPL